MLKINADKMTLQEQVDYIGEKLAMQGVRSTRGDSCRYGTGRGQHCAVGWILDTTNQDLMRHQGGVSGLKCSYPNEVPNNIKLHTEVFRELQRLHDCDNAKEAYLRLRIFKGKFPDVNLSESWNTFIEKAHPFNGG